MRWFTICSSDLRSRVIDRGVCFDEVRQFHRAAALEAIERAALVPFGPVLPQLELPFQPSDLQFKAYDAAYQLFTQFSRQVIAPGIFKAGLVHRDHAIE